MKSKKAILKYLESKKCIDEYNICIKEFTLNAKTLADFKDVKNIEQYDMPLGHIYYEGDKVWLDPNG